MSGSTFRIPRVTAAVLLLGGACGGDGDGDGKPGGDGDGDAMSSGDGDASGGSVDVSAMRIDQVARAYCAQYEECYAAEFASAYDSQTDCIDQNTAGAADYVEMYGEDCTDAMLDAIECASKLDCNEDPGTACTAFGAPLLELCPEGLFEPVMTKSRGLRIPR